MSLDEDFEQEPEITGWTGNAGSGKTTGMVDRFIAKMRQKKYTRGFGNLHLDLPDYTFMDLSKTDVDGKGRTIYYPELEAMRADSPNGIPTCAMLVDQIHKYAPSHRTSQKDVLKFVNICVEMRQHGFDLYWTTWAKSSVVNRIRKFTELQFDAYRVPPKPYKLQGFSYVPITLENGPMRPVFMPLAQAQDVWTYFQTTEVALAPKVF